MVVDMSIKCIGVSTTADIIIEPIADRWYNIMQDVTINVFLQGEGKLVYDIKKGFLFDGRSGGPLCDFIAPNLGTQKQVACWLIHDLNGYDQYLCFADTNELLRQMLINCGTSSWTSWLVKRAVSLSDSWFGEPKPSDREYPNLKFFTVRHYDKEI